MAAGELLSTALGAEYLNSQGLATHWVDARQALRAERRLNASIKASLLNATCDFAPDAALQARWVVDGLVPPPAPVDATWEPRPTDALRAARERTSELRHLASDHSL